MRRLLPLAFLLVACAQPPTDDAHKPDGGAATTGGAGPATSPAPPATPVKAGTNPNRVHQLADLRRLDMNVKGSTVHAWIMDDEAKMEEGMMFLTDGEVKADEGMLFAFPSVQPKAYPDGKPRGFWMHNTLIPLDIVYMTTAGKVISVGHGKVQDDTTVPPGGEFQYVLELKAGTAARLGLKAGDAVPIPKL